MSKDSSDDDGRLSELVRRRFEETARLQAERVNDRSEGWRHSVGVILAVLGLIGITAAIVLGGFAIYWRSTTHLGYAVGCLLAAFVLGRIGLYVDTEATGE